MSDSYNTLCQNLLEVLTKNKCKNVDFKEPEFCITFTVKNDKHYEKIKSKVKEEEKMVINSNHPRRITSMRKLKNKCTLNFVC